MSLPPHDIAAAAITAFHDQMLRVPRPAPEPTDDADAWHWIARNHGCNTALWDEEDQARRTDVPDHEIVRCKRAIDRHNQQRNDAVERIDAALLAAHGLDGDRPARPGARLSSETAGAMIDRLSILALKIHHMGREAQRVEAGESHVRACAEKVARLRLQREDLAHCLDRLLHELARGEAWFRVYRQFKMYNDPTLNPRLYGARTAPALAANDAAARGTAVAGSGAA